ncbi:MAG: exosortase C-terminal domain/associated protein EpsI [Nitrospirota bacterium]
MNSLRSRVEDTRTQIVVLALLFLAAYYVPLRTMVNIWRENEDYSYGFMIPLASAYLLWEKRKTISRIPVRPAWKVLPLLVIFVLLSLYGILGSSGNISMPVIPVLIILFVGFFFGIEFVKELIMPLGFLFFMVPVPAILERYLGLHLKSISTNLGGAFIGLFNIPVYVSGNIIDLGVTQLQVVDACSGMRYIFPLLGVGILYAYFFERVMWKRIVCVLVTLPTGVLFNAFRIGITGILTNKFGPKVSQGFFHDFSGWVIFLFAIAMLFVFSRLLSALSPKTSLSKGPFDPKPAPHSMAAGEVKTTRAFLTASIILVCVAGLSLSTSTLPAMTIQGGIEEFPLTIGKWEGSHDAVNPVIVKESGAEEAFSGYFRDGSGKTVSLYMGYRSTAFLANENFFHSPTVCMPSSGWVEQDVKRRTISDVPYFDKLSVMTMVIEKEGIRQLVYFWFQTKDEATYDKNINRFHLSLHALRRDNTYDLFMRPITMIQPAEKIEDAERRLDGFVREMMPILLQFLKEKQV